MKTYINTKNNMYMNVHGSLFIIEKLKTTQMPLKEWMVKQILVHPYNGTYSTIKKGQSIYTCNNMKVLKGIMLS